MTKYVPQHLTARSTRSQGVRDGVNAMRGSRSAVAVGVTTALPLGTAALMTAPAFAAQEKPAASAQGVSQPVLAFNAKGGAVETLQSRLALVDDGWFGPVTTAAVKDFQRANGLDVDGVVGPDTWKALDKASTVTGDSVLSVGDKGPLVRTVQQKLGVEADGVFGPKTRSAVVSFQEERGLEADGVVGPKTTYALARGSAAPSKKAAASKPAATNAAKRAATTAPKPAVKKAAPKRAMAHPNAPYELPFLAGFSATISQGPFGAASHHKSNDMHHVDWAVPQGTTIVSSASGTVYSAENNASGGNTILIRDASGYCMEYAHLSVMNVTPGQRVAQGQRIALSGSTGHSTGPHLHWGLVDCSSYTSIKIADSKELGTSYIAGAVGVSRNGA